MILLTCSWFGSHLVDLVEDADDFVYLRFGLAVFVYLVEDADDFAYLQFGLAVLVDLVEDADEVEEDLGRRGVLLHGEVSLHVAVERVQQEHVAYGPPLLLLLLVSTDLLHVHVPSNTVTTEHLVRNMLRMGRHFFCSSWFEQSLFHIHVPNSTVTT